MPERFEEHAKINSPYSLGGLHSNELLATQGSGTEILDNLKPATTERELWEADSFEEMVQRQENIMQTGTLKKTNIAVIMGGPVYGKTFAGNQWAAELLKNAAAQGGVSFDIEDDVSSIELYHEKLRYFDFEWVDAVEAAVRLGIVERKPYGMWTPDDTSIFTAVATRAVDVIREGSSELEGIEGNAVGLVVMKMPMTTAAGVGEGDEGYEYIGLDRGFNLLRQLQQEEAIANATFALPLTTDGKSQQNRLLGRTELNKVQTSEELRAWFASVGIKVPPGAETYLQMLSKQLPGHSADIPGATAIAYQTASLIMELVEMGNLTVSTREFNQLGTEVELIDTGKTLVDPEVYKLQNAHMNIVANRFYPKLITDLGMDKKQGHVFRGKNTDVKSVTVHPRVMTAHNLIDTIWRVNPMLLYPPSSL